MHSDFDDDTALRALGDGRYEGMVTDRWDVGDVPNGGYVLALAVRALARGLPHPDPMTVTGHYLRRASHVPSTIDVAVIRSGRTTATGEAVLRQDGSERLRVLGTYGDLSTARGPTHLSNGPPGLPPPSRCTRASDHAMPGGAAVPIMRRVDLRFPPGMPGWAHGTPSGSAELVAWLRFADGRPVDTLALPLLVDCFPPPIFELGLVGWIPTIELTCHVRARPEPGWLRCAVRTRFLQSGLLDEEIEVWDEGDRLVAIARQLAVVPPDVDDGAGELQERVAHDG